MISWNDFATIRDWRKVPDVVGGHLRATNLFSWEATKVGTILLVILILLLIGAIPSWPHSRQWGYAPSGLLGTIFLIVLILFLLGRV